MTYEDLGDEEYVELELPVPSDEGTEDFGPAYLPPVPVDQVPREFKPWHRPRKHFVRRRQWLNSFVDLLDEIRQRGNAREEATYIGLPGSDLLDVRMFAEECGNRGFKLRYLGFDRTASEEGLEGAYLNLIRDELFKSGNVHRESLVMPDEFSTLSDVSTLAYTTANRLSFDVVNLDLCGSATNEPGGPGKTTYLALRNLLKVQSKREEPWLLLMTATFDRGGQGTHGLENAQSLVQALSRRLAECTEALGVAQETFSAAPEANLPDPDLCDEDTYAKMLVLAFVHWLCSVGKQIRPSRFKLMSVLSYRLEKHRPAPDMFSLAIRVTPKELAVSDVTNLLPRPRLPDECSELTQQTGRMSKVVDVDEVLRASDSLFEEMRSDMAGILASLRYDREAYLSSDFSMRIEDVSGSVMHPSGAHR